MIRALRNVLRLFAIALACAGGGGTATAFVVFPLLDPDSAVARNIACVGPALLLTALILHRLSPLLSPSPVVHRLTPGLAALGLVLVVIPPFLMGLANHESLFGPTMLIMLGLLGGGGTIMSLLPATVGVFALAGATALLRAAGVRVGLLGLQALGTAFGILATAGWTLHLMRVNPDLGPFPVVPVVLAASITGGITGGLASRRVIDRPPQPPAGT